MHLRKWFRRVIEEEHGWTALLGALGTSAAGAGTAGAAAGASGAAGAAGSAGGMGMMGGLMGGGGGKGSAPPPQAAPQTPTFQQSQVPLPQAGPVASPPPMETVSNSMYPSDIQQSTVKPVAPQTSTWDYVKQIAQNHQASTQQAQRQRQLMELQDQMRLQQAQQAQ